MSKRIGDIFVIAVEPDGKCELCGTDAELRPYGPNGERICFDCAMKDRETTRKQFVKVLDGVQDIRKN